MSFIKHHKKFVALFVVLSFLYLVEISYLPLRAEPAPAKAPVSMNGDDQAPGSIETEGSGYVPKKKSSPILPIIIGVVVLGAVAAVLILVVFKSNYNIAGNWTLTEVYPTDTYTYTAIFTGDKKSGTVDVEGFTGPYTVNGKNVSYNVSYPGDGRLWTYTGKFDSKNKMSGTGILTAPGYTPWAFTWSAVKQTTAAAPTIQNPGRKGDPLRKN